MRGHPGCYITRSIFDQLKGKRKRLTEDSFFDPCVSSSAFLKPLLLYPSVHFGFLLPKRKANYILWIRVVCFSLLLVLVGFVCLVGWLVVVWVLWHINLCRLFNAKSIFMNILLFQTIQFHISTQFKCKYRLIVQNISISFNSIYSSSSNSANSV